MESSHKHSNEPNISVVTARLFEIILDMPFKDRRTLLKEMEAKHSQGRRRFARKPYFMPVDFATPDRAFSGFIQNISSGGSRRPTGHVIIHAAKIQRICQSGR
jgi:hypothetical protein